MRALTGFLKQNKKYIIYFFVGVLTTVVNYIVYFLAYNTLDCSAAVSNIIAWFVAVIFSFFANKFLVFASLNRSMRALACEFLRFLSCRIVSGGVETGIIFVAVDILNFNSTVWKVVSSIFVIVLNYFGSKFIVFRNKA